jgi:hypothetical protein
LDFLLAIYDLCLFIVILYLGLHFYMLQTNILISKTINFNYKISVPNNRLNTSPSGWQPVYNYMDFYTVSYEDLSIATSFFLNTHRDKDFITAISISYFNLI